MRTQEVIEGLLYITNNREVLVDCLKACHILNDEDRDWKPVQHTEFYFLEDFKYCTYLMLVDKQVHIYLIGEKVKGRSYNILNVEGFTCELLFMGKTDFIKYLKEQSKIVDSFYLPNSFGQRIVYLKPNYKNNTVESFIFNRQNMDSNMFRKSSWNFGTDIYTVNQKEYSIKADEILKEILSEVE